MIYKQSNIAATAPYRFDIAKVEIKLFKKKWSNYCLLIILCYKEKFSFLMPANSIR